MSVTKANDLCNTDTSPSLPPGAPLAFLSRLKLANAGQRKNVIGYVKRNYAKDQLRRNHGHRSHLKRNDLTIVANYKNSSFDLNYEGHREYFMESAGVRYLHTSCFCIRNGTSEHSERVRFLIQKQQVGKYRAKLFTCDIRAVYTRENKPRLT